MSSETGKAILIRHKTKQISVNRAIEEASCTSLHVIWSLLNLNYMQARDYVYAKVNRQQGHKATKGQKYSDSESSPDETTSKLPNRKKPIKKAEEQELIRSRLVSHDSKISEFSTTSLTDLSCHDVDSQLCRSDSNTSSNSSTCTNSTVTTVGPEFTLVNGGCDVMDQSPLPHYLSDPSQRHSVRSRDSGFSTDFDSQERPSPPPCTPYLHQSKTELSSVIRPSTAMH
jgi:hypothetical protein